MAATRIGADVLLLNTAFAGPALAEVVNREHVDTVIYDEEFTSSVDQALTDQPAARRILAWTETRTSDVAGPAAPTLTRFMDEFGEVIYNNYNATEAGMIATAAPEDLRAAPDTAGRPAVGTEIRIHDQTSTKSPPERSGASS